MALPTLPWTRHGWRKCSVAVVKLTRALSSLCPAEEVFARLEALTKK
jgi:hypothetical protein